MSLGQAPRFIVFFWCLVFVVAGSSVLLYLGEDFSARYRLAHRRDSDPLDEVTFYYATMLKNGKLEIFWDQPQRQVCIRSLFPHLGYGPCWYVRRRTVKVVQSPSDIGRDYMVMGTTPASRHHDPRTFGSRAR
jgi:hypothetical protein